MPFSRTNSRKKSKKKPLSFWDKVKAWFRGGK